MRGTVGVRRRVRGVALACVAVGILSVVAPWSTIGAVAAGPPPALLTPVDGPGLGTFDRGTLQFRSDPGDARPEISRADYMSRRVPAAPSGMVVEADGNGVLKIGMWNASGPALTVDPPVTTYTGP